MTSLYLLVLIVKRAMCFAKKCATLINIRTNIIICFAIPFFSINFAI